MSATWKAEERRVAKLLHGRRNGATGRNTPDVENTTFAVECKHRKSLPAWLWQAVDQARRNAPDGKLPLVVLHEKFRKRRLVVLDLSDFLEWYGEVAG